MRVFTAVPIPESLQGEIILSTASLRGRYPKLKWVSQQAIHITLNFLGEIEEETAPQVLDAMETVKQSFNSFDLEFRGLGVFPRCGPARVVYLEPQRGIQQCQKLQQALARQLAVYAPPERKKFKPHTDWPEPENGGTNITFGFTVQRIVLYKSILKPDGAHYEEVGAVTAQIT
jgi:2'-5' RNA ligase